VRAASSGARVLDVFASTGGFSVAAAAGGASSVHLVDVSGPALEAARRNLALNEGIREVRACEVRTTRGDAFEVLADLGRRERGSYDVVVLDPPSFAQSQRSVPRALDAYARLTSLGVRLVRPGGLLVQASCSSRVGADEFVDTVLAAAERSGVSLRVERRTGHPVDHPIGFDEGAYLKAVFARVTPA
jgi:23S rRNA (cytosine1962-C5)-methyltransferase